MHHLFRSLAFIVVCSLLSSPAIAQKTAPASAAAAYVDSLGKQALSAISNPANNKEQKQKILEKLFADNIDFPWVGRFVMGRFWRQTTPEQQARYLKTYQNFLIKNYTSRFTQYTSGSFKITGSKQEENGEFTVGMEIISEKAGDPPIVIDYKVRKAKSSFQVFDIVVEGVSLINTQRSEFSSILSQKGVDALIGKLEANAAAPVKK